MTEFEELVKSLIEHGADPNSLSEDFESAVSQTELWGLWGDGRWRENLVCSKCGSAYGGICADDGSTAKADDFENKEFHKNQKGVTMIPYKLWKQTL